MFQRLNLLLLLVVITASLLASLKFWVDASLDRSLDFAGDTYILDIRSGDSVSALSRRFAAEGMVDSPYPLLIHSRFNAQPIMVGEYRVEKGESVRRLLERLVAGDVIKYRITFPEGRALKRWLRRLNNHPRLIDFEPLDIAAVKAHFGLAEEESLEGLFFPDTYTFTGNENGLTLLSRARQAMEAVLNEEWSQRSEGLPYETPYQALIMASIIEMETGIAEEREEIAGVFVRRIQQGMRLQTDPTVIYGLGEEFDGNLTRTHLKEENPYNTYHIDGLPPTPISNPGREAIHAALHPAQGEALYFVARGDGSHQFSTTLAEHQKAVKKYQLKRVKNYRSSPR